MNLRNAFWPILFAIAYICRPAAPGVVPIIAGAIIDPSFDDTTEAGSRGDSEEIDL